MKSVTISMLSEAKLVVDLRLLILYLSTTTLLRPVTGGKGNGGQITTSHGQKFLETKLGVHSVDNPATQIFQGNNTPDHTLKDDSGVGLSGPGFPEHHNGVSVPGRVIYDLFEDLEGHNGVAVHDGSEAYHDIMAGDLRCFCGHFLSL
jgi:hypothetical protein